MTTISEQFEQAVTDSPRVEAVAQEWQTLLRQVKEAAPAGLVDVLEGGPLGHPLHPVLVHLPLGGWMAAAALDFWPGGNADTERAADLTLLLATLGAVPTVATGWTEWTELRGQARRTGVVHGFLEESAFFLNIASLVARRRGKRGLGKLLSGVGLGAALAGGMLGGELVYGHGVGVKE